MKIAVIPARGGSKRIPQKNIKNFCGSPMISWSISVAKKSKIFDRIIVSTDDHQIASIAISYGAEVPFIRSAALADDYVGTTEVIKNATSWMIEQGWPISAVCCIYPTAPFILAEDLKQGLKLLESGDWAFVFSATDFAAPIFRAFQTSETGVKMFFPEYFSTRSQDLPLALHDAAQFYWGKPSAWMNGLKIFDKHSLPLVIPRWRVQDIDVPDDWIRAELIYKQLTFEKAKKHE